jgi:hypothetical protein
MSSLQPNWRRGQNWFCLEVRGEKGGCWGQEDGGERWPKQLSDDLIEFQSLSLDSLNYKDGCSVNV